MLYNKAGTAGKSIVTFILAAILFGGKTKFPFRKKWHSLAGKHGTARPKSIVTCPRLGRELCEVWFGQNHQKNRRNHCNQLSFAGWLLFCSRKLK